MLFTIGLWTFVRAVFFWGKRVEAREGHLILSPPFSPPRIVV